MDQWGISDQALMESAGSALFSQVQLDYPEAPPLLIFAGAGNNGADGLVLARYAFNAGWLVHIVILKETGSVLFEKNLEIIRRLGISVCMFTAHIVDKTMAFEIDQGEGSVLLVDALAGIGLRGKPRGVLADAISTVQGCSTKTVSIDVPSGIGQWIYQAEESEIQGSVVRAQKTYTLGCLKTLLYHPPNRSVVGHIHLLSIGFPSPEIQDLKVGDLIENSDLFQMISPIKIHDYKSTRGRVGIAAGSSQYPGAGVLAAKGALAGGAGIVFQLAEPQVLQHPGTSEQIIPVDITGQTLNQKGMFTLFENLKLDSLVLGSGRPPSNEFYRELNRSMIISAIERRLPLVLDAGGILSFSEDPDIIRQLIIMRRNPNQTNPGVILTPHLGEFSQLIRQLMLHDLPELEILKASDPVRASIYSMGTGIADTLGITLLVKSHVTWIFSPNEPALVYDGIAPALGFGGSGDILAGVIAAYWARNPKAGPRAAAAAGVIAHGQAGKRMAQEQGFGSSSALLSHLSRISYRMDSNESER
jgi:NAD(P)H-hydrate epimerase